MAQGLLWNFPSKLAARFHWASCRPWTQECKATVPTKCKIPCFTVFSPEVFYCIFRSSVSFCQTVQSCAYSLCSSQPLENHYLLIKQTSLAEIVNLSCHSYLFQDYFIVPKGIENDDERNPKVHFLNIFCASYGLRLR